MVAGLRVYIVSTFTDLREHRDAVDRAIRRLGFDVISVNDFGSTEASPVAASIRAVEAADIVVILLAHRLGYVPPESYESITEIEYSRAIASAKPVLAFVVDDDYPWPFKEIDPDFRRVESFRQRLLESRLVTFFTTPDDLAAKVSLALSQYSRHIVGVVPEPTPAEPATHLTLHDVISEIKSLRAEINAVQQTSAEAIRRSLDLPSRPTTDRYIAAEFLGTPALAVEPRRCFVIMPYSEKWSGAVERIILEVCSAVGLKFQIAKSMDGRFIPNDIWRGITGAGVLVADLSGANPNVTYEIGLADVLGKHVILIAQGERVPFDFLAQRLVLYQDSLSGTLTLREELTAKLGRYVQGLDRGENA